MGTLVNSYIKPKKIKNCKINFPKWYMRPSFTENLQRYQKLPAPRTATS